jgi:hypothetical protein
MRGNDFTLALTFGAGLLALWLDARLVSLRPKTPGMSLLHAVLSLVGLAASVGLLYLVHGVPQTLFMVAVLTVFLPALIYALLAALWMLRALTDLTGLARR